jgi:hypothetical protein
MNAHLVVAALAAATFAAGASAQNLKPGLWEVTNNMKGGGGEMEKQMAQMQRELASMPPEQRKMMEEMMAKQGMKMGAGGSRGMSVKQCMTKEMVERNEMPAQQGDCRTTKQQRSGNVMKFSVACTNPPSTGEGQVTFVSPEAYTMKMAVNSGAGGRSDMMNMEISGKWLSADCGSVKPVAPPVRR